MSKRIDLASSVPLPAPFVLYIEPTNLCNFRCPICPESLPDYAKQAGYHQNMSCDTWRSVLRSLREWQIKLKVIRFFSTGEPLIHPELSVMIAESLPYTERTEVTTNGHFLCRPEILSGLLASGLHHLRISVYGTTQANYEKAAGTKNVSLEQIIENVRILKAERDYYHTGRPHILAELVSEHPKDEEPLFRSQWSDIADELQVKPLHNWGDTFVQLGAKPKKLVCPYPFYEMFVKANGDVTVCCVDWKNELKMGNVNTESLAQIWSGRKLGALRQIHLDGFRHELLGPCRDCNVPDTCPDDLDSLVRR